MGVAYGNLTFPVPSNMFINIHYEVKPGMTETDFFGSGVMKITGAMVAISEIASDADAAIPN